MSRALDTVMERFNSVQRDAVIHREGPALLLAGAGSGKTGVVTARIAQLLEDGVPPQRILALTFTNRAAREMSERIEALVGPVPALTVSTFHAFGARFLRGVAKFFGRSSGFSIYDTKDQIVIVTEALVACDVTADRAFARRVLGRIDAAKNAGHPASRMTPPDEGPLIDAEAVGAAYDGLLERADAFDFGDLVLRPALYLAADTAASTRIQRRFPWVLVDEFQDTNAAQYTWLQRLAPPGSNLFVVGDDDQSIYGWRGAEVANILSFATVYPTAKVMRLEQNYRSVGNILTAANAVIAHNENRLGKSLFTTAEDGMLLEVKAASDGRSEANWIASRIVGFCRDDGFDPSDIAVLMRANYLSLDLEQALRVQGVSHHIAKGRAFYDRAEVRDALAWLRILANPNDDVAFVRATQVPRRGIGKKSLARLSEWAAEREIGLFETARAVLSEGLVKGRAKTGLASVVALMDAALVDAPGHPDAPSARYARLLEGCGLLKALSAGVEQDPAARDRLDNVLRLIDSVKVYEDEAESPTFQGFLEQVKLVSDTDTRAEGGQVTIMTIHAAKGLEFPIVFVMGMEEGIFPTTRSVQSDQIEEERRLCYVALTRAQQRLLLTRARTRRRFTDSQRNPPSRFLLELPAEVVEPTFEPIAGPPPRRRRRTTERSRPGPGRDSERARVESFDPPAATDDELCVDVVYDEPWAADSVADDHGGAETFRPGMRIWHGQLGLGRIVGVSAGRKPMLTVDFGDELSKVVRADYVSVYEG